VEAYINTHILDICHIHLLTKMKVEIILTLLAAIVSASSQEVHEVSNDVARRSFMGSWCRSRFYCMDPASASTKQPSSDNEIVSPVKTNTQTAPVISPAEKTYCYRKDYCLDLAEAKRFLDEYEILQNAAAVKEPTGEISSLFHKRSFMGSWCRSRFYCMDPADLKNYLEESTAIDTLKQMSPNELMALDSDSSVLARRSFMGSWCRSRFYCMDPADVNEFLKEVTAGTIEAPAVQQATAPEALLN
jgi:hypothetical protein